MSKTIKYFLIICSLILLLTVALIELIAPSLIRRQITSQIEDDCRSCEFTSKEIYFRLFPTRIILNDVHFMTGDAKTTLVDAHAEKVILPFTATMLMRHIVKFNQVVLEKPTVVVTEGDLKANSSTSGGTPSPWDLEVDHIDIKDGQFTYHRVHDRKTGTIQINYINGGIGEMGSTSNRKDLPVTGHVTATFEQSGKIDLTVSPLLFSKEIYIDLSLDLNDLNLIESNRFFGPYDGIKVKGTIMQGHAEVSMRGKSLHSQVEVNYHGLSVKFRKTTERSGLTAFITNLFSGIKPLKDRSRAVTINRNAGEPLVGFILRGMSTAALKVARD